MEGKSLARGDEARALLGLLRGEADAPPFWMVPDLFQGRWGRPPRRDAFIGRLRAAGFRAARSHLDPQGVRTDAGVEALRAAWS
jgi:tRNA G26 N,N-dimethylase Trm1